MWGVQRLVIAMQFRCSTWSHRILIFFQNPRATWAKHCVLFSWFWMVMRPCRATCLKDNEETTTCWCAEHLPLKGESTVSCWDIPHQLWWWRHHFHIFPHISLELWTFLNQDNLEIHQFDEHVPSKKYHVHPNHPKSSKIIQIIQNHPKSSKIIQNHPKSQRNWGKMGHFWPTWLQSPGDVKKEKTLQPGHQGWAAKAAYLEAWLERWGWVLWHLQVPIKMVHDP